jgi:hypothetical protein
VSHKSKRPLTGDEDEADAEAVLGGRLQVKVLETLRAPVSALQRASRILALEANVMGSGEGVLDATKDEREKSIKIE